MEIFEAEKSIQHLLQYNKTVALASISTDTATASSSLEAEALVTYLKSGQSITPVDSYWFSAILVSTNWNRNDDVFTPDETWPAKDTVVNKPVSWKHNASEDNNEVIGVVLRSVPVDINYAPIQDKKDYFHIAVSAIIWNKYFPTYGKEIEEGIDENELFVSMECHFPEFGFAIRKPGSSNISFIERNAKTAVFTKYLRIYGGPGIVKISGETYQIGRWLKKITFTGMGLVHTPGNFESKILGTDAQAENLDDILENRVLINTESTIMSDTNSTANVNANAEAVAAMEELAKAKSELAEAQKACAAAQASEAEAKAALAKLNEDMAKCSEAAATANAALAAANESLAAKDKALSELQSSMAAMQKTAMATARLEQLKLVNAAEWISSEDLGTIDEKTFNVLLTGAKAAYNATSKVAPKEEVPAVDETAIAALKDAQVNKEESTVDKNLATASQNVGSDDFAKLSDFIMSKHRKSATRK